MAYGVVITSEATNANSQALVWWLGKLLPNRDAGRDTTGGVGVSLINVPHLFRPGVSMDSYGLEALS
jgi:hypothetical protein